MTLSVDTADTTGTTTNVSAFISVIALWIGRLILLAKSIKAVQSVPFGSLQAVLLGSTQQRETLVAQDSAKTGKTQASRR